MRITRSMCCSMLLTLVFGGSMSAQWTQLSVGSPSLYISGITSNSSYLYVASPAPGSGVHRSSDDGVSWTPCNSGFYAPFVTCMASRNDTLFAGHSGLSSRFYVSANNGNSWVARGLSGWNHNSVYTDSNDIFVSTSYGLYKTTNLGSDWTLLLQIPNAQSFAKNSACMVVGMQVRGMRCSSDGGAQWDSVPAFSTNTVNSLITYQNTLCAGISGVGFAISTDNGATWTLKNSGLSNLNINLLYRVGNAVFAGTQGGGVFRTTNLGDLWTQHNDGMTSFNVYAIGSKSPYLYVGSDSGRVYKRLISELVSVPTPSANPEGFALRQNYPNPFNPTTSISYVVGRRSSVRLKVFSLLGSEVATLVDEVKQPGQYAVSWDASGLAGGVYFCRFAAHAIMPGEAGSYSETKKLVVLR